ncbi:hypothetical protein HAX54_027486, partial [Datura stramonium]|nr:hypothetical protein [Datura stramonium]
ITLMALYHGDILQGSGAPSTIATQEKSSLPAKPPIQRDPNEVKVSEGSVSDMAIYGTPVVPHAPLSDMGEHDIDVDYRAICTLGKCIEDNNTAGAWRHWRQMDKLVDVTDVKGLEELHGRTLTTTRLYVRMTTIMPISMG